MTRRPVLALIVAGLALLVGYLWLARSSDEREIRRRLDALVSTVNAASAGKLGAVAQAARLGKYVTEDVEVELGASSLPIRGRETVIGMAARLQPRTAAYTLAFRDVEVEEVTDGRAEVSLTAVIRHRPDSGRETIDAREFSVTLRNVEGEWQVSRVIAIDTLRR